MQPLKGLNTLDDHNDKHLQDNDILVGSGPSPVHWFGFFHFVDLVHEAQYLYEGIVIIDHSILRYIKYTLLSVHQRTLSIIIYDHPSIKWAAMQRISLSHFGNINEHDFVF